MFGQDYPPVHTSRLTKIRFQPTGVCVFDWPARSPDLHPVKNIWGDLARQNYGSGKQYSAVDELKTAITDKWNSLDTGLFKKIFRIHASLL